MRKLLLIMLAIVFCCVFVACSPSDRDNSMLGSNDDLTSGDTGEKDQVTITFKQVDKNDIVIVIEKGASLTDVPNPQSKTGYMVAWNKTDFTNICEDMTVTAIETAKTYTVILNADGGSVPVTTMTVTYGQPYELPSPVHPEYAFSAWRLNNQEISLKGTWTFDADNEVVELFAQWGKNAWSDFI